MDLFSLDNVRKLTMVKQGIERIKKCEQYCDEIENRIFHAANEGKPYLNFRMLNSDKLLNEMIAEKFEIQGFYVKVSRIHDEYVLLIKWS